MTTVLRQIKIHCPTCGEFLFRVFRQMYNLDTKIQETEEYVPLCQTCRPVDYFQALKSAQKIEMLHFDSEKEQYIYKSALDEGEKVQDLTGRKPVESEEPK